MSAKPAPIVARDYDAAPDSEGCLLSKVTLIDTETKTMEVIDLPEGVEYTFRDIARGPNGEILIIATDGALHTMDPETGEITTSTPVVDAWEGPVEWQDPHPAIKVVGGTAYITDPAAKKLHAVDIATGEIMSSDELPGIPNEITAVEG